MMMQGVETCLFPDQGFSVCDCGTVSVGCFEEVMPLVRNLFILLTVESVERCLQSHPHLPATPGGMPHSSDLLLSVTKLFVHVAILSPPTPLPPAWN